MMRKIAIVGLGVFALGLMASCGGGHTCDAYRASDYSKYKTENSKKIESKKSEKSNR